ncbi:TonB family protein [Pseudomonas composti]|uniref:TonB family protein n=1 Tax=Ectopseudomonas composti TaxID=658457 RepID=UPI0009E781F3
MTKRFILLPAVILLAACSSTHNLPPKCIVSSPTSPPPEISELCSGKKCDWQVLFPSGEYPATTKDCRSPVVQNPTYLFYPQKALMQCIEGHVWVAIFLNKDGVTTSAKILQSSNVAFDKAALSQARQLSFEPMKCQSEVYDSVVFKSWSYIIESRSHY